MATIAIDFTPPDIPGIVALRIYEGPTSTGPFVQIERTTAVGAWPIYITRYTSTLAASSTNWFQIAWEDAQGDIGEVSYAFQGGTSTLIGTLVNRVMLRDESLNEVIVTQVAEAIIYQIMQADPYDPTLTATYAQLEGMTLLILARSRLHSIFSESSSDSYTAGLISIKESSSSNIGRDWIDWLIAEANALLGINMSAILLMEDIAIGNSESAWEFDHSRLRVTVYEET